MTDWLLDIDARVIDAIKIAKERGFCSAGDAVIVVTGWVNDLSLKKFFKFFSSSDRVMVQQIHCELFMPIKYLINTDIFVFSSTIDFNSNLFFCIFLFK
jgi:hypothetical protein